MTTTPFTDGAPPLKLLVVCTMNQARSPLGEVIARHVFAEAGRSVVAASAGTEADPTWRQPAVPGSVAAAARLGLDLRDHRSRAVDPPLLQWAELTVTMERRHVVDLVTRLGAPFARVFTLPELAELARTSPRRPGERRDDWFDRIGTDRTAAHLMDGPASAREVPDPIGRSNRHFRRAAATIEANLRDLVAGMYPDVPADSP